MSERCFLLILTTFLVNEVHAVNAAGNELSKASLHKKNLLDEERGRERLGPTAEFSQGQRIGENRYHFPALASEKPIEGPEARKSFFHNGDDEDEDEDEEDEDHNSRMILPFGFEFIALLMSKAFFIAFISILVTAAVGLKTGNPFQLYPDQAPAYFHHPPPEDWSSTDQSFNADYQPSPHDLNGWHSDYEYPYTNLGRTFKGRTSTQSTTRNFAR